MNSFDEYVFKYDMNNKDVKYKYYHSYRVMEVMKLLSEKLNLSTKDIQLAKVIGLLHDIGRFEQNKLYNNFKDTTFDHGNYGVKVLKESNILEEFEIDKEDYEVVYKAIDNHNQFKINSGLNERELLFSKLIRDADKLDILYALGNKEIKEKLKQDDCEITKQLQEDFFSNKIGNLKDRKSYNDHLVITFCFIYDINFKETYEIIKENKYYEKIYERINRKDIFEKYLNHINKYIKERIDEYVR